MRSVPKKMKRNRKAACIMPATGVFAPERILVAVRAIAPVAGRQPNSAEPILATPCPISSWFERCSVPAIPSATTDESSASIPERKARGKAERSEERRVGKEGGRKGRGGGGREQEKKKKKKK